MRAVRFKRRTGKMSDCSPCTRQRAVPHSKADSAPSVRNNSAFPIFLLSGALTTFYCTHSPTSRFMN